LSLEPNSDLVPLSAYRDTPAGNQLVPWYPVQNQVKSYTSKPSRTLSLSTEPGTKRYTLGLPSYFSNNEIQPELPESAYNSRRRLETPKMNQVGLLIDIYA
jgi:hypothetical protein